MRDLIDRQAAIDAAERESQVDGAYGYMDTKSIVDMLNDLPSVQPEIIKCKDCKWFNDIGCAIRIVDDTDKPSEEDYCSMGERRDG